MAFGGQGSDTVDGGAGDDPQVNGNLGEDVVHGGDGNDSVYGGKDSDTVYGDVGDDRVSGDLGNDIVYGGAGADKFAIAPGGGQDWIGDWSPGEGDKILLPVGASYTVTTYLGQTIINLSDGTSIGLAGVGTFDPNWIAFG
jgi:serralysin